MADQDRAALIKKSLLEGKSREETKVILVSNGFSGVGFESEYASLVQEFRMQEPKKQLPLATYKPEQSPALEHISDHKKLDLKVVGIILVLVAVGAAIIPVALSFLADSGNVEQTIQWGLDEEEKVQGGLNLSDTLQHSKVESTALSAYVFAKRMGSFDGVCRDISVVAPIVCKQEGESFVLFSPQSDGSYFCVDRHGFKGAIAQRPATGDSCE